MREFINKLRTKSPETRHKIAIGAALGITLVIVGGWFLGMKNSRTDEVVKEKSTAEDLKPLFLIFKNAKEGIKNVKTNVESFRANVTSAEQQGAPAEEMTTEESPEDFTIIE